MKNNLPTFYPMGDQAIVVQFEQIVSISVSEKVQLLTKIIETETIPGVLHVIPSFNNVTICYDAVILTYKMILEKVKTVLKQMNIEGNLVGKTIHLPVVFGGEYGPDLSEIAERAGLTTNEFTNLMQAKEYYVFAIGFIAGFPYSGEIDSKIQMPRRETPRSFVPKGTVQIVSNLTGVFTTDAPSGWHMIGWTPMELFNPYKNEPSMLHAGDRIKYVAVEEDIIMDWNEEKQSEWDDKWNM